ncbi:hypothetical protein M409DRAFT_65892 [Zasmidium cellare ATCC 36951]|uniref:NAD dependent epimerase/dehydratase n=1 Tax=Zasmidium cellare ATCC 36951 TaxID=1080233 RepID=A0A6A6CMC8_ZASCE|nr:uncharacterized protein M409DRAFT_65892 [Zasmidium cellare ATCC 36951]KAF2167773.1 hypothetical protein M409DRAFT_65892 [Zasmidium cellare ATCC 36951]
MPAKQCTDGSDDTYRTGTASLHTALSRLGYRVYHFSELVRNGRRDMDLLHEALVLKHRRDGDKDERQLYGPQEFDKIWGKYDAVGGLPGFAFVDELVAYYPQAQFIMTDRNVDSWARAMRATCLVEVGSWSWYFRSWYDSQHASPLRRLIQAWIHQLCRSDFGDELREAYIDHVQHCLKIIPKEKLLIMRFGQESDWHDLCDFLGKTVPDMPYPVVDDELEVLQTQGQTWLPQSRLAFGKAVAFALGAVLTAASCWLLIE